MTRVSRRRFVQGAGVAGLGLLAGCGRPPGQVAPTKVPRIGFLSTGYPASTGPGFPELVESFRQGLRELGYVEGENLVIEYRWAEGDTSRLPELAAELVALPVDLIFTVGGLTAEAARDATSTIPIVMVYPADPIAAGLVASFARPGGNITGLATLLPQLGAKQLDLLKEIVPGISRVGVLRDPDQAALGGQPRAGTLARDAAAALGIQLELLPVSEPDDLDRVLDPATRAQLDAVLVGGGRVTGNLVYRSRIVALLAQHRLPTMYYNSLFVRDGGLMSYATSTLAQNRRAAYYVDRILKGTKPADLPVELPREFEFVINLKTAQVLGLTIPPHVLLQATEVIQ